MLSFDALQSVICLLEEDKVRYCVFGGIALDGLRGAMTREHGDLDLYIHADDLDRCAKLLASAGHPLAKRENMFFAESGSLKIGVVVLSEEADFYVSHGNKTLAFYPKHAFATAQHGRIQGLVFNVAPNEVLVFEAQHSRFPADKSFAAALPCDPALFKGIRYAVLRAPRG